MMPVMDGATFVEEKNSRPELAPIPICIMTASGRTKFERPGVIGLLAKPFGVDGVISIVERYCCAV